MERFVARKNIEHYQHLLESEQEPAQRARLQELLAEAVAELERQRAMKSRQGLASG